MSNKPIPRFGTLLRRGWMKRCPRCGRGQLFRRYNQLYEHCAVCGLVYLENEGDLLAYIMFVDRALFIFPVIVMIYFRLYNPNSVWFFVFGGSMLFGLIYTLPHRTGVSLALDYLVRLKAGDQADANGELK